MNLATKPLEYPGLILTTYCMRYPHTVPFLKNKTLFSVETLKTTCRLGGIAFQMPYNLKNQSKSS